MSFACHLSACFRLETYGGKMSVVLDNVNKIQPVFSRSSLSFEVTDIWEPGLQCDICCNRGIPLGIPLLLPNIKL